jgi:hypothetical protein
LSASVAAKQLLMYSCETYPCNLQSLIEKNEAHNSGPKTQNGL